jgi:hypothetical protein
VARTTDAWIDWGGDDGSAIVANEDREPTERSHLTDAWNERIVALLRQDSPGVCDRRGQTG